jgi:Glycosyl transferases group 1
MSLRVLVSGMACSDPWQGGATWAVMQYVLGLRALGHDVWFVEPVGEEIDRRYVREVLRMFELEDRAAFVLAGSQRTLGVSYGRLRSQDFDAHFNVSGILTDADLVDRIPVRVYVDLDPAFNQVWHEVEGIDMRLDGHTHFVSVGQAIGSPGCRIPTCGVSWITAFPLVHLASWPRAVGAEGDYTTVGHWRSYGSILAGGWGLGQRAHSMRELLALPARVRQRLTVALAIDAGEGTDLDALERHGWKLLDPAGVAGTPSRYRRFIQSSRAEISIAKSGYVTSRCGWFSDRSACYLASGRPVVAQDTGLNGALPIGRGLLLFRDLDEAVRAIEDIESDYAGHADAARELAIEHFDARRVLQSLLERVGLE